MTEPRRHHLAWLAVAGMAISAAAPWLTFLRGRAVTAVRSLMPWSALSAIPVAVGALITRRRELAVASGAVGLAGVVMSAPLVRARPQPLVDPAATPLRITHSNLLYINRRVAAVPAVLERVDADVLTFSELTPTHLRRLLATGLAEQYPHRVEHQARRGSGTGLWSRWPVTSRSQASTTHHNVVADVDAPGGVVTVIVIHTQSPIDHHPNWVDDIDALGEITADGPAIMTGDFNASWWHPELRRLMRRGGWRDAHQLLGHGLSCSWPTDQWHPAFRWHPPFVRLDHALVNDGLTVLDVGGFHVPGSDHRGIAVTVQRARPPAP